MFSPILQSHKMLLKSAVLSNPFLHNCTSSNPALLLIMTGPVITRHYSSLRMRGVWCPGPGPMSPYSLAQSALAAPSCLALSGPSPNAELPRLTGGFLTHNGLISSTWQLQSKLCRNNKCLTFLPSVNNQFCVWVKIAVFPQYVAILAGRVRSHDE